MDVFSFIMDKNEKLSNAKLNIQIIRWSNFTFMSLCAHLAIYSAFFDLWYLSCLLYNIERDENLYDNSLTQFAFLLYVHSLFTRTYNIDNQGDFTFASEINMIHTLHNQYYYLLLSGKLSFCTLSKKSILPKSLQRIDIHRIIR